MILYTDGMNEMLKCESQQWAGKHSLNLFKAKYNIYSPSQLLFGVF